MIQNIIEKKRSLSFEGTGEYVASEELMASVNIAMALKKPLLIKGEPGTGKIHLVQLPQQIVGKLQIRLVDLVN